MTLEVDVSARLGGFVLEASFAVADGETAALLGPNGAGKSTLLAVLAGVMRPAAGHVRLGGAMWDDAAAGIHAPPQARSVGVVFQDLLLFPHLSALENAAFPLRARGVPAGEARALAGAELARLGVGHRAAARPGTLSGGEAQRVALARALACRPRLLLLDEPLASLDVRAAAGARAVLRDVLAAFDGPALVVTHDPIDVDALADRAIVLEGGGVAQDAPLADARGRPRTAFAAAVLGANIFRGRLEPLPDGAGRLETPHGDVVVAWPEGVERAATRAVATLDPSDVTLHLEPMASSARNTVTGRIEAIHRLERAGTVRVRVAGRPPVAADVTPASLDRLGLDEGATVRASFKAAAVRVVVD